ncbi:TPA: helix-turn-helix domain-containing protein [Photobacterium damselae]
MRLVPKSQFEVTAMLARLYTPDLKAPEKLLLLILSDYGDSLGGNINPSLSTLAERSCMSRRSVIDNLKKLEDKGYIARFKGGVVDGHNVTNKYYINMEKLGFKYNGLRLVAAN